MLAIFCMYMLQLLFSPKPWRANVGHFTAANLDVWVWIHLGARNSDCFVIFADGRNSLYLIKGTVRKLDLTLNVSN